MLPISVLVVDSNPSFLRFVVQYLDDQHSETIHVAGAAFRQPDALALAVATAPQVALVGLSGCVSNALNLIGDLRHMLPALEVVALSQLGSAGYAQAALAAGADMFVDKDRLQHDLVPAILQVTAAHAPAPVFEA